MANLINQSLKLRELNLSTHESESNQILKKPFL